ncbi:MAG: hypothetical protein HON04_13340 [Planctomicrobium sp.]|jgi:dienelactone hydrolase|nr:hypothetical protein [Planctomicrobium sp.]
MKYATLIAFIVLLCCGATATADNIPKSVSETWALFDPHAEPLETELIRESVDDDIVLQHIRFVVGTFSGKKTRVAAFYAFPKDCDQLPGIVQIHGGGQWARSETALYWASQGYAAIAINWGEKVIDQEGDPNTDWQGIPAGFIDPKHNNDVTPGEGTVHQVAHPWNSSWLLYSAAARRAITFLEEQPEVDGLRIGLTGHSMGGRLTVLTAIDPRVKAASPSVGGSGYLYTDITGVPGSARRMQADLELYNNTLDCRSYWPLIECPVMFFGATNDFNSPMEKVIQGFRSLPNKNGAMSLMKLSEAGRHSVSLPTNRFVTSEGEALENYDFATSLILTPGQKERPDKVAKPWQGKIPVFNNLRWTGCDFAKRPRPYLKHGDSEIDADAAFHEQFDANVKESVQREAQDRQ